MLPTPARTARSPPSACAQIKLNSRAFSKPVNLRSVLNRVEFGASFHYGDRTGTRALGPDSGRPPTHQACRYPTRLGEPRSQRGPHGHHPPDVRPRHPRLTIRKILSKFGRKGPARRADATRWISSAAQDEQIAIDIIRRRNANGARSDGRASGAEPPRPFSSGPSPDVRQLESKQRWEEGRWRSSVTIRPTSRSTGFASRASKCGPAMRCERCPSGGSPKTS